MSEDSNVPTPSSQPSGEVNALDRFNAALARAKAAFPRSADKMQPFLDAYRENESITMSAEAAHVDRTTVWTWRKNEDFKAVFTENHFRAQEKNNDLMRKTAIQLATIGAPRFLIKNGQHVLDANGRRVVAYYEHYPNLIAFMLKNRLPNEFKDKFEHEINSRIVVTLVSEFISIIKRMVPVEMVEKIQKELETSVAKMSTQS